MAAACSPFPGAWGPSLQPGQSRTIPDTAGWDRSRLGKGFPECQNGRARWGRSRSRGALGRVCRYVASERRHRGSAFSAAEPAPGVRCFIGKLSGRARSLLPRLCRGINSTMALWLRVMGSPGKLIGAGCRVPAGTRELSGGRGCIPGWNVCVLGGGRLCPIGLCPQPGAVLEMCPHSLPELV